MGGAVLCRLNKSGVYFRRAHSRLFQVTLQVPGWFSAAECSGHKPALNRGLYCIATPREAEPFCLKDTIRLTDYRVVSKDAISAGRGQECGRPAPGRALKASSGLNDRAPVPVFQAIGYAYCCSICHGRILCHTGGCARWYPLYTSSYPEPVRAGTAFGCRICSQSVFMVIQEEKSRNKL